MTTEDRRQAEEKLEAARAHVEDIEDQLHVARREVEQREDELAEWAQLPACMAVPDSWWDE